MEEMRIVAVNGMLGYGFEAESLAAGIGADPQIVGADAGSTEQWQRGHWSRDWVVEAIGHNAGFSAVERAHFAHGQSLSIDGVVERVATTSHIASAPTAARDHTLAAVRAILDSDPNTRGRDKIDFAYVVDAYWCARR